MKEKKEYLVKDFREIIFTHDMEQFKKVFEECRIDATEKDSRNKNAFSFPGLNEEQMQFLIDNGLDINGDCGNGLPAVAYQAYSVRNLKFLIEKGADINLKLSTYPGSAMEYAENHHAVSSVANLIECGANADFINLNEMLFHANNIDLESLVVITKYMLNIGIEITDKMRKEVYRIGERFEYYRDSYNKESVDAASDALYELYEIYDVEPAPRRILFDGKSNIVVKSKTWQKQHDELWDMLVPSSGKASTVQGELIRIIGKILYEILDNGAINWDFEFKKMADAMPTYFEKGKGLSKELVEEASNIARKISRNTSEKDLYRLNELTVNWIIANPKPIKLNKVNYDR